MDDKRTAAGTPVPAGTIRTVTYLAPSAGKVLVRRDDVARSYGRIILPETVTQEKPVIGTVIAVGPPRLLDCGLAVPAPCKVGDKVFVSKYGGTEVKLDGVEHIVIRDEDVHGVFSTVELEAVGPSEGAEGAAKAGLSLVAAEPGKGNG